jgi:drug/metabolite transporter (DMT)-like permease
MRRVIGVALMVDGLATALWFSAVVGSLGTRDALSVAAILARVAVGMVSVIAGWLVTQRRPPGDALAPIAAAVTALVVTAGFLWRLIPTNMDPTWRLPMVGVYWGAALVIGLVLTSESRSKRGPKGV